MKYVKSKGIILIVALYSMIKIYINIKYQVIYTNLMNLIFWIFMLCYLTYDIKQGYIRFNHNKTYYIFIISLFYSAIYIGSGFIFGFSRSPYGHNIFQIIQNIIIEIMPIVGIEIVRGVVVTRNKGNPIILTFITLILISLEINYITLIKLLIDKEEMFRYICSTVIPIIANNILCTYIAQTRPLNFTLIYRVMQKLIVLLLPVLPNANWYAIGSINIIYSLIVYLLFKYVFLEKKMNNVKNAKKTSEKISYTITLIICILLILFMLGVFQYEPIVILSNSMSLIFSKGDVVIYKKIDEKDLSTIPINSIIIYTIDNQNIAHRIINRVEEGNTVYYQTKGDNNNVPDSKLVAINQIKGIYVFHIKYIGFLSVWLNMYLTNDNINVFT